MQNNIVKSQTNKQSGRKRIVTRMVSTFLSAVIGMSFFSIGIPAASAVQPVAAQAAIADSTAVITKVGNTWTLENQAVKTSLSFADGSVKLTSFYNKAAEKEYITDSGAGSLFSYTYGDYLPNTTWTARSYQTTKSVPAAGENLVTMSANDGGWTIGETKITDITMIPEKGTTEVLGKQVSVVLTNSANKFQVTLVLGVYDGYSGLHYQTYVKNTGTVKKVITDSDVLKLSVPNEVHYMHYVNAKTSDNGSSSIGAENSTWKTTTGNLAKNTGRNALMVYQEGHGWWIMPETNWRTQDGPVVAGSKSEGTQTYNEFATTSYYDGDQTLKVTTNPQSMQLTLKGGEEFQYIGVNLTAFAGDVVDGKMAAEEHFQKRFKFHDTSTILNTNDWDYTGKSNYEYFQDVIIPQASKAGVEMVMIDDWWNLTNPNNDKDRDGIAAVSKFKSLSDLGDMVKAAGLKFGIWYSLTGYDHNGGRDLADPVKLSEKKEQIRTLITDYKMAHQMIDLTEFWQTKTETSYSSPSDSVYRKNVMSNQMLNELVAEYPEFLVKLTNEVDVYPTQGNRNNGLLHLVNNGWLVHNGGLSGGMKAGANTFGYLPLSTFYTSGTVDGAMSVYYHYMFSRNVKLNEDPGGPAWTDHGVELMSTFNSWRKGERVAALTDLVKRPTYLGPGWDGNDASAWTGAGIDGPYSWMHVNKDKTSALMISTSFMSEAKAFKADTRWVDSTKQYLVADVTLDDIGAFTYAYKGLYSGTDLVNNGFTVDLTENTSGGKAYWFQAVENNTMQVVFADENAVSYSSSVSGNIMTLTISGTAGEVATVIVGCASADTGRVIKALIGENGETVIDIPLNKLYAPSDSNPINLGAPIRVEFEDMYKGTNGSLNLNADKGFNIVVSPAKMDDSGSVGASGGDYRSVSFGGAGQYITCNVPDVAAAGKYIVRVGYKGHNNTGKSALGQNGAIIGEIVDYSTGSFLNKIVTQETVMNLKAGTNAIDIFCVEKGGGNSDGKYSLRIDYVECVPVTAADTIVLEAENLIGQMKATGAVLSESAGGTASGGKTVLATAGGAGAIVKVSVTAPAPGKYDISAVYSTGISYAKVQAFLGANAFGSSFDQYAGTGGNKKTTLGMVSFAEGETKEISFIVIGRNASYTSGYNFNIDAIELVPQPVLMGTVSGDTMQVGEILDLTGIISVFNMQPEYCTPESIRWAVESESVFDVAEVSNDGLLTANHKGTAVIRATNRYDATAYFDFIVTVVPDNLSNTVLEVIKAINQIGVPVYTETCNANITVAENKVNALTDAEKAQVSNYYLLKNARLKYNTLIPAAATAKPINYLDEITPIKSGGTYNKGRCPGSHLIQFTGEEGAAVYERGFGFEGTESAKKDTLLFAIPKGTDKFYAKVGLDYAMSENPQYDNQNVITFYVDGIEKYQTGKIVQNKESGAWVDKSYAVEFDVPAGAEWLLIENDKGTNHYCDHILFADARFENFAAAGVERLIGEISPANVNISEYKTETAEKIRAAENAYYALDTETRTLVSNLNTLLTYRETHSGFGRTGQAGLTSTQLTAVELTMSAVDLIPSLNMISIEDAVYVTAAGRLYDTLDSVAQQDCVNDIYTLIMAKEWMKKAGVPEVTDAAEIFFDFIETLPGVEDVKLTDKTAVTIARAVYNTLTAVQQQSVKESADKLKFLEERIQELENVPVRSVGDTNGDGEVDIADMMRVRNIIVGSYAATEEQWEMADVNGDGEVDIADIMRVRNIIIGSYIPE